MDTNADEYELDPVFVNSLREAKWILAVFLLFACYTVGYCYLFGYQSTRPLEPVPVQAPEQTLGIPSWVLWGILLPWLAANAVTAWFCFAYMQHDPLDEPAVDRDSGAGLSPAASPSTEGEDA